MKIFASCVIKNEADIIEETLKAASTWADRIFVLDNGSTDGTWEKIQSLGNDIIVPWKQDDKPFQESRRAEAFNAFRHEARNGDWWCRLDSDEFYVDDPRVFLAKIPRWQHIVWGISIEYYLTQQNLKEIDFSAPTGEILPKLHYYRAENSELRFFRHRDGLVWNEDEGWPRHLGIPARERIRYKHYKYRSPQQIQQRTRTRLESIAKGFAAREHWQIPRWEDQISSVEDLDFDDGSGTYRIREERLPHHLDPLPRALVKQLMHGFGFWA